VRVRDTKQSLVIPIYNIYLSKNIIYINLKYIIYYYIYIYSIKEKKIYKRKESLSGKNYH